MKLYTVTSMITWTVHAEDEDDAVERVQEDDEHIVSESHVQWLVDELEEGE